MSHMCFFLYGINFLLIISLNYFYHVSSPYNTYFQVQLQIHSSHGKAWILQFPQLVRRKGMVPLGPYCWWHSLPRPYAHLRRNPLSFVSVEYPCAHQRYMCLLSSCLQVCFVSDLFIFVNFAIFLFRIL